LVPAAAGYLTPDAPSKENGTGPEGFGICAAGGWRRSMRSSRARLSPSSAMTSRA